MAEEITAQNRWTRKIRCVRHPNDSRALGLTISAVPEQSQMEGELGGVRSK